MDEKVRQEDADARHVLHSILGRPGYEPSKEANSESRGQLNDSDQGFRQQSQTSRPGFANSNDTKQEEASFREEQTSPTLVPGGSIGSESAARVCVAFSEMGVVPRAAVKTHPVPAYSTRVHRRGPHQLDMGCQLDREIRGPRPLGIGK